jgi:hypothetical protein
MYANRDEDAQRIMDKGVIIIPLHDVHPPRQYYKV